MKEDDFVAYGRGLQPFERIQEGTFDRLPATNVNAVGAAARRLLPQSALFPHRAWASLGIPSALACQIPSFREDLHVRRLSSGNSRLKDGNQGLVRILLIRQLSLSSPG